MIRAAVCLAALCAVVTSAGCGGSSILTDHEQIYVVAASGGSVHRLTSGELASLAPSWSPDGKRLAFVQGSRVAVVGPKGRPLVSLASGRAVSVDPPSWSPDGRRLAFTGLSSPEGIASIVVARQDRFPPSVVATTRWGTGDSDRGPIWSPNGRLLVYCVQGPETPEQGGVRVSGDLDLAVVSPSGAARRLTSAPGSESDPRWSPDGQQLLYSDSSPALRLVPAAGGRSQLVVRLSAIEGASWSPNGKLIAFAGSAPDEQRMHLYVVRPDGTGLKRLTGEITPDRPVWSPDGKLIAFSTYAPGIDVIAPDGASRKTVVSVAGAEIRDLAWSPTGTTIAFAARTQLQET